MQISPTVSLNYSRKELNSNSPSNAIMLSTPLRRNYAKCHLYNTQTPTNLFLFTDASNYSYSGILLQAQDEESDHLIVITYFSGKFQPYTATLECHSESCVQVY